MQNNEDRGSLAEKFRDFGAAPSDALWNSISEQLGEKKKRRIAAWWWWTSGLAATLAALIALFGPDAQQQKAVRAHVQQHQPMGKKSSSDDRSTNALADRVPAHSTDAAAVTGNPAPQHTPHTPSSPQQRQQQRQPAEDQQPNTPFPTPNSNELTENQHDPVGPITVPGPNDSLVTTVPPSESDSTNNETNGKPLHDSSLGYQVPATLPPVFQPKWSIAVHGGGARGFAAITTEQVSESALDNLGTGLTGEFLGSAPNNGTIIEMRQYWSGAVHVTRYFTGSRFAIESGIEAGWFRSGTLQKEYAQMSSAYASGSVTTLTFAIPLSVQMRILSGRKLQLSAGAGIVNHLPFFQRVSSVPQSANNMELLENSRSMTYIPAAQLSLNLRYNLSKHLYLDIRPQLRHYFEFPYKEKDPGAAPYILDNWWGGTVGLGWKF